MARKAMAGLLVVGLGIGIWWLWPQEDEASPYAPSVVDAVTISSPTPLGATTTIRVRTTTTDSHVVESVEDAEAILRELWFGWFEGIYLQDEDRIRGVVATEEQVDIARDAFGALFTNEPMLDAVRFRGTEILRSDDECLATWGSVNVTAFRGPEAVSENVVVMRYLDDHWVMLSTWVHREDLWNSDCESLLQPAS